MSARSIRRSRERALKRRSGRSLPLTKSAGTAAGITLGATLALAPAASAEDFVVDDLDGGAPDTCAAGSCTLREAIADANANAEADTITFLSSLSGTIDVGGDDLDITEPDGLTITETGPNIIKISGEYSGSRVFDVDAAGPVVLNGLRIEKGLDGEGAGIRQTGGDLTINDSSIRHNRSDFGAGILNEGGTLTINNSRIALNHAKYIGGGILSSAGVDTLTINNSTITGNKAVNDSDRGPEIGIGGGIAAKYETVVLSGTDVSANYALTFGGGISAGKYTDLTIQEAEAVTLRGSNQTSLGGPGQDSTITRNEAPLGGGLALGVADLDMTDTDVSRNDGIATSEFIEAGFGGGIFSLKYGDRTIADSTISSNTADSGVGGGIFHFSSGSGKYDDGDSPQVNWTIDRTTIDGNEAGAIGGGVGIGYLAAPDTFTISNSTLSGNSAVGGPTPFGRGGDSFALGGGVGTYGPVYGSLLVSNSTVSGNDAEHGGGLAFGQPAYEGEPNGPAFAPAFGSRSDEVGRSGDGRSFQGEGGSIRIANTTVASNAASEDGGGIWRELKYEGESEGAELTLSSTIVGDNTADGSANDLAEALDTPDSFVVGYSLVEAPGSATITDSPAGTNLIGAAPGLNALTNNGGPTLTHKPTKTSAALDVGIANGLDEDQRGLPRSVDLSPPNNPAGDPTDIGAVERDNDLPPGIRPLGAGGIPVDCPIPIVDVAQALEGNNLGQTISGSPGNDILRGRGGTDSVIGRQGDDCLTGDDGNDQVRGQSGDDWGTGGAGNDFMKGNAGDDEFAGQAGADRIRMAAGDDFGRGNKGDDRIAGGGGDDVLRGDSGDDRIRGDSGNDILRGGEGNDTIFGGGGINVINCGPGKRDKAVVVGDKDKIGASCEIVIRRGK